MTKCTRSVDPLDVMRKSLRFDLIFKVELADAWLHGDRESVSRAEEAYLESIRARNGFWQHHPPKADPETYIRGMRAYLRRFPDGRLASEFAKRVGPDEPFPDWTLRVRELRFDSWLWRVRERCFLLKAALRTGVRRAKSLRNADECRHRAAAPLLLARYLEKMKSGSTAERERQNG